MNNLLSSCENLPPNVRLPRYAPAKHAIGIMHLGLGAFHKAHQAAYTDEALAKAGGDWRIVAVSMRNKSIPKQINDQNGLFTLLTSSEKGYSAQVIGSIASALSLQEDSAKVLDILSSSTLRILSITITEKGYGILPNTHTIDLSNPVIAHDLQNHDCPIGALGLIVAALKNRRAKNIKPFSVLCCDNLPKNGQFVQAGVLDFAQRLDKELAKWIKVNVTFPCSMVDRITPAQSAHTLALAQKLTKHTDKAAIETEAFHQWIIEDNFPNGRPKWEAGGAFFTNNIAPYEKMKLRMLNGSHSMLAYGGFLLNHTYVRDVMTDKTCVSLIKRHMNAAASTLTSIDGTDFQDYADTLIKRFTNPAIAHETHQIAMDGSQKLPQRIFAPALNALEQNHSARPFAFATALWMRYCTGLSENNRPYTLHDPREVELKHCATRYPNIHDTIKAFNGLTGIIPDTLSANTRWDALLVECLYTITHQGVQRAMNLESSR